VTSSWGYAVWVVLAVAALALWASSHAASRGRGVVVRPAAVLARLATDPWLRVPLVLGWAWVGWHLFAR
jgi:hypothetical protein